MRSLLTLYLSISCLNLSASIIQRYRLSFVLLDNQNFKLHKAFRIHALFSLYHFFVCLRLKASFYTRECTQIILSISFKFLLILSKLTMKMSQSLLSASRMAVSPYMVKGTTYSHCCQGLFLKKLSTIKFILGA